MSGNGIIGLLILFIMFNLVSRILQAIASQKAKKPDETLRRRAGKTNVEPSGHEVLELESGKEPTLESPSLAAERARYEESSSAEDRTSLESWLEEIFERQGEIESQKQKHHREHFEAYPSNEAIDRYASFERSIEPEEDIEESRRKRSLARLHEHRMTLDDEEPGAKTVPRSIKPQIFSIRNSADLKRAVVGAEIIGPCKARVFQYRMRNRIAREFSR